MKKITLFTLIVLLMTSFVSTTAMQSYTEYDTIIVAGDEDLDPPVS